MVEGLEGWRVCTFGEGGGGVGNFIQVRSAQTWVSQPKTIKVLQARNKQQAYFAFS